MNIIEILKGNVVNVPVNEQQSVLEQMKEKKIFDLGEDEKLNLINFLCDKADTELAIDYLFHVLDEEISYPIDEEKVRTLFSDERMHKMKELMMKKLQDEDKDAISEKEAE